jgi:hypothetical protein
MFPTATVEWKFIPFSYPPPRPTLAGPANRYGGRAGEGGEGSGARVFWTSAETGEGVLGLFEAVARMGLARSVRVADGVADDARWARMRDAAGHDPAIDDFGHVSLVDPLGPRRPAADAALFPCCQ